MALTRTTLSAAVSVDDTTITVASATGFAAGYMLKIDQETLVIQQNYTSGTSIPVRRGQNGSATQAHVTTAGVVVGRASLDFADPALASIVNFPLAGRTTEVRSVTATSSLVLQQPGSDLRVVLNGTSVITLTVPIPTTDMDGDSLTILSNGAAAHVLTFTGGLGAAGSGYTALTNNASGQLALTVYACNATWCVPSAPAWTGTVTKVTGGIA